MTQTTASSPGDPPTGEALDALLERALGLAPGASKHGPTYDPPPTPSPPPRGAPPRRRRASGRLLAGIALVAALAAAYLVLSGLAPGGWPTVGTGIGAARDGFSAGPDLAAPDRSAAPGLASVPPGAASGGALLERVPAAFATRCRPAPGLDPVADEAVICTPGGGVARLEIRSFVAPDALRARYRAIAGEEQGGRGVPRCAAGEPEERAWAASTDPDSRSGRYACHAGDRARGGSAEIWWTADASLVIGHAVGGDGDLAALFEWWRAAPDAVVAPRKAA